MLNSAPKSVPILGSSNITHFGSSNQTMIKSCSIFSVDKFGTAGESPQDQLVNGVTGDVGKNLLCTQQ